MKALPIVLGSMVSILRFILVLVNALTPIWNDLIRFHQKRNLRVAHKVTIKFNALNSLVRKGA